MFCTFLLSAALISSSTGDARTRDQFKNDHIWRRYRWKETRFLSLIFARKIRNEQGNLMDQMDKLEQRIADLELNQVFQRIFLSLHCYHFKSYERKKHFFFISYFE